MTSIVIGAETAANSDTCTYIDTPMCTGDFAARGAVHAVVLAAVQHFAPFDVFAAVTLGTRHWPLLLWRAIYEAPPDRSYSCVWNRRCLICISYCNFLVIGSSQGEMVLLGYQEYL